MKKIILLMLILIAASAPFAKVFADEPVSVVIESKNAKAGDQISVNINLENNSGILAMLFDLTYDTTRLKLAGAKDGGLIPGSMFSQTTEKYPYIMLWNSVSPESYTDEGVLAVLTFEVLEDALPGQAFIQLDYEPDNVYDADINEVELNITNGYINIAGSSNSGNTGTSYHRGGSAAVKPSPAPTAVPTEAPVMPDEEETEDNRIILWIDKTEGLVFGELKYNDVAPIIRNDRTMLPARFVAENLGAKVEWFEEDRKVSITTADTEILLIIDSDTAYINGEQYILDSPAFIENDRTYTPVRFVAEGLGATVDWNEKSRSVIITK